MQCACAILSFVACPALQYFSTLSHERHDFRKKKNTKCVFIFSTTFVWNISHSEEKWTRYDKKCILVFMYPLFLSNCNETWIFFTDFRKSLNYAHYVSSNGRIVLNSVFVFTRNEPSSYSIYYYDNFMKRFHTFHENLPSIYIDIILSVKCSYALLVSSEPCAF
jgi:hypothetical protein